MHTVPVAARNKFDEFVKIVGAKKCQGAKMYLCSGRRDSPGLAFKPDQGISSLNTVLLLFQANFPSFPRTQLKPKGHIESRCLIARQHPLFPFIQENQLSTLPLQPRLSLSQQALSVGQP